MRRDAPYGRPCAANAAAAPGVDACARLAVVSRSELGGNEQIAESNKDKDEPEFRHGDPSR